MSNEQEGEETLQGVEEQGRVRFWLKALTESKAEAAPWVAEVKAAWREYMSENDMGKYRERRSWECSLYPRYWADSEIIAPALYGNRPTVVARRRFDRDPVARTASILAEKLANYLLDTSDFDVTMPTVVQGFVHGNSSTARVYFEAEKVKRTKRVALVAEPYTDEMGQQQTQYTTANGDMAPDDVVVLQDEQGGYYYEVEGQEEELENPRIYCKALHFDEVRISTGARALCDKWWEAYHVKLTVKAARQRFGPVVDQISAKESELDDEDAKKDPESALFSFWEVWDKRDKRIYWVHESLKDRFLDQEEDLYELIGFFPAPKPMMCCERHDSLYPVPDYTQTRDMYEQMHLLARRLNVVTQSIEAKAIADGTHPELQLFMEQASDGDIVYVPNIRDLTNSGGLEQMILFLPYEKMAGVLSQLIQVFSVWQAQINEIRGIPDLHRGASEPVTSATAERIKSAAGKSRYQIKQREVQRFARDLIEHMLDLALKTFSEEQLKEVVGYAYLDAEDQQRFPAAILMLKDDKARLVRVDIETDSTIALNEQQEKESAVELLTTTSQYIGTLLDKVQSAPHMAPLVFKVLELGLMKFRHGKHAEDELGQVFQQLQQSMAPKEPAPPPPDYKAQELQLKAQAQQLDQMRAQMEGYIKQAQLQIEQMDAQLRQRQQVFSEQLEVAKLNQDQREQDAIMRERLMEEQRLAAQNITVPEEKMMMAAQTQQPQQPPVVINLHQAQPEPQAVPVPVPVQPEPDFGGELGIPNPYFGGSYE